MATRFNFMKSCSRCHQSKPLSEFNKDKTKKDGLKCRCKSCWSENSRESKLLKRYGINLQQYIDMLTSQNNKCAICTKDASLLKKRLAVDHCHATGKIRGLLCSDCNLSIGHAYDDPKILINATQYLLSKK